MASFHGHHAVVTGGGRGIGRAGAASPSAAGPARAAGGEWIAAAPDARALREGRDRPAAERGVISILVANAGGAESAPFGKSDSDLFRRMFELNLMGGGAERAAARARV